MRLKVKIYFKLLRCRSWWLSNFKPNTWIDLISINYTIIIICNIRDLELVQKDILLKQNILRSPSSFSFFILKTVCWTTAPVVSFKSSLRWVRTITQEHELNGTWTVRTGVLLIGENTKNPALSCYPPFGGGSFLRFIRLLLG